MTAHFSNDAAMKSQDMVKEIQKDLRKLLDELPLDAWKFQKLDFNNVWSVWSSKSVILMAFGASGAREGKAAKEKDSDTMVTDKFQAISALEFKRAPRPFTKMPLGSPEIPHWRWSLVRGTRPPHPLL